MKFLRKKEFKKMLIDSKIYKECSFNPKINNCDVKSKVFDIPKNKNNKNNIIEL